jgi:hypothetical protein
MVLSRLVGTILIALILWATLIIIGRIRNAKYSNLFVKLRSEGTLTKKTLFDRFWKQHATLARPGSSHEESLDETYIYYYRYSMNYLSIALLSVIILALVYCFPLVLTSFFGVDNISTSLMVFRKYVQILSIALTSFGFFAHHRCHYQVEMMYKELTK